MDALPLAWLPNQDGFRFVGVKADGTKLQCIVKRGSDGTHRIENGVYAQLIGWERIT